MNRAIAPVNRLPTLLFVLLMLAGCARVDFNASLVRANQDTASFTAGRLTLAQTEDQRKSLDQAADALLAQPLSQAQAVQLALANSPDMQALLARNWAEAATAAQRGRPPNPMFTFERIALGDELELNRMLSFGLLDLLTLPRRAQIAEQRIEAAQLRLAIQVVDQVTRVRRAWVDAVAARQSLAYAKQVFEVAEISAELARRMQQVGNFNRLQRARQQSFYADAASRWAVAQHAATAGREELIRLLGLDDQQASRLSLPERLPDLPTPPRTPEEVSQAAKTGRLDLRLAQALYNSAAKEQGLETLVSLTDIELGLKHDTVFDDAEGSHTSASGYELSVRLPLFDGGDMRRAAMNAHTLAATNQLTATARAAGSNLREAYSAYRTAHDLARHYRDEVLPLRRIIAEENLLRYNGMLIGVFELLADTRDQIQTVLAAIRAEQDFWLTDAALQAALVGNPATIRLSPMAGDGSDLGEEGH